MIGGISKKKGKIDLGLLIILLVFSFMFIFGVIGVFDVFIKKPRFRKMVTEKICSPEQITNINTRRVICEKIIETKKYSIKFSRDGKVSYYSEEQIKK